MTRPVFCDEHTIDYTYRGVVEAQVRIWMKHGDRYKMQDLLNWLDGNQTIIMVAHRSMPPDEAVDILLNDIPEHYEIHALQVRYKPDSYRDSWVGRVKYTVDF